MKKLAFLAAFTMTNAFAIEFSDIVGTYKITHPAIPAITYVSISNTGVVELSEDGPQGVAHCAGQAQLEGGILESELKCFNGASFEQQINLSQVEDFSSFSAPVFSTLYGVEIEMNFEKVELESE